ncbi:NADH:flavin oxidoreductase/NADH oxidase domain-containing protein [Tieghemostelium lacteum]|uniref:NADH:flavin oxidoreductase/NADH oxidase domain-containing protein n=1 Tax=Tieghemostelium lacteum TaxID=361077 RepID=A0A152A6U8_TIELA|nr:NADH:flavin oxidoreductase/NADH oxidase domain-containing protein [Tieghemostelium lacteum]|eukprot:KYR01797.1 NADH:flavin oxidoreductase/NADH oxidase domain-containing protein [Tieghemostelium lacteum]
MVHREFEYPYKLPEDYLPIGHVKNQSTDNSKGIPTLFQPIQIKDMLLKNRIIVSPMCMYSSKDGYMNDFHMVHYSQYSRGGASLIIFEASAVCKDGRISSADAGIYMDEHIEGLKKIVNFIHANDTKVGIQISHAGRKSSSTPPFLPNARRTVALEDGGWEFYGPTEIPFHSDSKLIPHQLTIDQINEIIKSFGQAARRALEAGFDMIDLHSAHGYLLDSFLSSTSNKRTDQYGGDFNSRIKLLLDVIKEVRVYWPISKPLFVRISCTEWVENGWTLDDSLKLTEILQEQGLVDLIDCSTGGNSQNQKITVGPMYQVPFSSEIRQKSKILTSAVGLIKNAADSEEILKQGKADLIMYGRPFLKDPYFGHKLASELGIDLEVPIQYNMTRR